jgi:methionine-S-sulfoxide reductase
VPGVIRTRVGYAGGTKPDPTYYNLGDYTETIEMDYDPQQVSYEHLLELFWQMHSPTRPAFSRQYRSAVFFRSAEQEKLAREVKARIEKKQGVKFATDIEPLKHFYLAEDYHQKYYLRQIHPFEVAYESLYPKLADFINSTAVARVNGFVGGSGDQKLLEQEIKDYGLDENGQKYLLNLARNSHPIKCTY